MRRLCGWCQGPGSRLVLTTALGGRVWRVACERHPREAEVLAVEPFPSRPSPLRRHRSPRL